MLPMNVTDLLADVILVDLGLLYLSLEVASPVVSAHVLGELWLVSIPLDCVMVMDSDLCVIYVLFLYSPLPGYHVLPVHIVLLDQLVENGRLAVLFLGVPS